MREMSKWNSLSDMENGVVPAAVKVNDKIYPAGPGHFGKDILGEDRYTNQLAFVSPLDACTPIQNKDVVEGKFGIAKRGQCTFAQKVRNMQGAGIKLAIIIDNVPDSTQENTALFAMSGDGKDDIEIPAVFLFSQEGQHLTDALKVNPELVVVIGELKSLKREQDAPSECTDGNCEAVLEAPSDAAADKESFDHLKKVLSQLVAQFELSLSSDDHSQKTCSDETVEDVYISKNKFVNEDNRIEGPPNVCSVKNEAKSENETPSTPDSQPETTVIEPGNF